MSDWCHKVNIGIAYKMMRCLIIPRPVRAAKVINTDLSYTPETFPSSKPKGLNEMMKWNDTGWHDKSYLWQLLKTQVAVCPVPVKFGQIPFTCTAHITATGAKQTERVVVPVQSIRKRFLLLQGAKTSFSAYNVVRGTCVHIPWSNFIDRKKKRKKKTNSGSVPIVKVYSKLEAPPSLFIVFSQLWF